MKEGGKPRDEERRKAGKGKEGKKESHEGFDTQVRNISDKHYLFHVSFSSMRNLTKF